MTWLIHIRNMTQSNETWLIHIWDMALSHLCNAFLCVTYVTTHSYMWHDSFICVTWLLQTPFPPHNPVCSRNWYAFPLFLRKFHCATNNKGKIPGIKFQEYQFRKSISNSRNKGKAYQWNFLDMFFLYSWKFHCATNKNGILLICFSFIRKFHYATKLNHHFASHQQLLRTKVLFAKVFVANQTKNCIQVIVVEWVYTMECHQNDE